MEEASESSLIPEIIWLGRHALKSKRQHSGATLMKTTLASTAFIASTMLIQPSATSGEIYRWVDDAGRTHYSQELQSGARRVRTIEIPDYYTSPSMTYVEDLDKAWRLGEQLAAERKQREQRRREAQIARSQYSTPRGQPIRLEVNWPLYPAYPLSNIALDTLTTSQYPLTTSSHRSCYWPGVE